jgi:hypothetical protein
MIEDESEERSRADEAEEQVKGRDPERARPLSLSRGATASGGRPPCFRPHIVLSGLTVATLQRFA